MSAEPVSTARGPVTVLGAGGFIGRHVVVALLRRGWRVRAFLHVAEFVPFDPQPGLEMMRGDVRDAESVRHACAEASAVVNAAGAKNDEPESEAVNVGGARHIAAAALAEGCGHVIQISTQSVKLAEKGEYARTKLAADEVLAAAGVPLTILRPSIVYGPGRSGVFSTMARFVERWPIVPILGDGRWVSAPVHVEDVASAVVACLATPATIGCCYDLGGPDLVSLNGLLDRIAAGRGRRSRKVHVPFRLALALTRGLVRVWPRAPVTVSNVLGSNQPVAIDSGPARRDFGFSPRGLDAGIRELAVAEARENTGADEELAEEAGCFAKYLLGVTPSEALVARYRAGVRTGKFGCVDRELRFVARHRWSIPLLDAAGALSGGATPLRRRIHLMAALLETTPEHAAWYLAPPPSRVALWCGLVGRACSAALKIAAGLVLRPLVR